MKKQGKGSEVVTFTVPAEIKLELEGVAQTGFYDSVSEFMRDAIRSFLKQEKPLRAAIAFHLFKAKRISRAKAGVMIGVSDAEIDNILKELEV